MGGQRDEGLDGGRRVSLHLWIHATRIRGRNNGLFQWINFFVKFLSRFLSSLGFFLQKEKNISAKKTSGGCLNTRTKTFTCPWIERANSHRPHSLLGRGGWGEKLKNIDGGSSGFVFWKPKRKEREQTKIKMWIRNFRYAWRRNQQRGS